MNILPPINLIIQGPIYSPGVNGEGEVVEFDCINNINSILDKYGNLFHNVVIVTWKKENTTQIKRTENLHILEVEDIGGDFKRASNVHWQTENVKRQFFSTWVGLDYLDSKIKENELVFKLRTDQSINFNLLITELKNKKLIDFNKIVIPFLVSIPMVYAADYYFLGTKTSLNKFLISQLNSPCTFCNAHESIALNYDKNKEMSEFIKFKQLIFKSERSRIKKLSENFDLFSKELLLSCVWRGKYIINTNNYQFDFHFERKFNIQFLILKYVNSKRFIISNLINRKKTKEKLIGLTEIMSKDNKEKVIITYSAD